MKRLMQPFATLLATTLPLLAVAETRDHHYYGGLHAGTHDLEGWSGTAALGGNVSVDVNLELDAGSHAGFILGREYEKTRLEIEYQRGRFDIDRGTVGILSRSLSASGDYQTLYANAYRTFHLNDTLSWYAGLGVGLARVELPAMDFNSACDCLAAADEAAFSIQGRVGIELHVTDNGNLFVQYTYLKLPQPGDNAEAAVQYTDKNTAAMSLGYRFSF